MSRLTDTELLPANRQLDHIPGTYGLPILGNALEWMRDPRGLAQRNLARFGPVHRSNFMHQRSVALVGADALQMVLQDRHQIFSSQFGWDYTLGKLFTRGLMLRDFADHRQQRRIMQVAFRKEALTDYSRRLGSHLAEAVEDWAAVEDFHCYPAIKTLTLNLTAKVFLGLELGPEATRVNRALIDTLNASMAFIRLPIPGLKFHCGLRGRRFLTEFFRRLIAERRASTATDMLTRLCHAVSEDGKRFADQDILDHMIFLLMAAHDTLTSSLTTSVYALARHTDWQEKVRGECLAAGWAPLPDERLDELPLTERVFNEALRLYTPVPYIPRRALKAFEYGGYTIPANTQILLCTDLAHQDPDIWTHPERFDPDRFSPERSEHKRHAFAFLPYGGGAHKCIGMVFAANLARQFLHQLLIRYRLALHPGYRLPMQQVPIPKPRDGLPMQLTRLE